MQRSQQGPSLLPAIQKFSEVSLLTGYDVVVCRNCGFCFADHIPDQAAFDLYYREKSKYEYQDRSGQPSELQVRRFPELTEFIKKLPHCLEYILVHGMVHL